MSNKGETASVGIRMDHHLKLTTFDFIQSCVSVNSFSQTDTSKLVIKQLINPFIVSSTVY